MRRGLTLYIFVLSVALAGCQFIDLRRELGEIQKFSAINGRIVQDTPNDSPVAVALFSEALRRDQLVDAQMLESREFRFRAPPGNYFIFAFEDTNKDFRYQPNEPGGFHGDPTPIVLRAGVDQTGVRITLRPDRFFPDPDRSGSARPKPDYGAFPKLWAGRKNIGAITSLEDGRFGQEFAKMGMWEPLRFSLEVGPGLFLLEPYDPTRTPVLFVHGIGATPQIWKKMIEELDRRRFQPWVLSYASGLPLEANARYMFGAVTQLRLLHGFKSLYVVAHSMGGLVSQAFIDRYRGNRARYLKLFVTLSTPWGGHDAAGLAIDYAPAVVPVWRDVAPASAFLTSVRKSHLPEDLPYYLLFSYRGGSFPRSTANDGSVTVASQLEPAAQARADKVYGFDTSHAGVLSDKAVIQLLNDVLVQTHNGAIRQLRTAGQ